MTNYSDRIVDRIPEFDDRSRGFSAVEGIEDAPLVSKTWTCKTYNDQGREGACVGFAWSHEIAAKPRVIETDNSWALDIYNRAKQIDPWPGEDYSGTSVLAGIKAVQEVLNSRNKPLIKEYRWAFGTEDVMRTLAHKGPVVLGIEWQSSFYTPDANAQIWLNNDAVGGHAILAKGIKVVKNNPEGPDTYDNVDVHASKFRLHNSWGTGYGKGGDCFMSVYDLNHLLMDKGGEACIPVRRSVA